MQQLPSEFRENNEIFNKRGRGKQTEAFRSGNNFAEQFSKRNSLWIIIRSELLRQGMFCRSIALRNI